MFKHIYVPYLGHFGDPISHFFSVTTKYQDIVSVTGKILRPVYINNTVEDGTE